MISKERYFPKRNRGARSGNLLDFWSSDKLKVLEEGLKQFGRMKSKIAQLLTENGFRIYGSDTKLSMIMKILKKVF